MGGLTQSGGIVNTIWRQTLKKVKIQKKEGKNCLILGLGGGGVVGEINKLWPNVSIVGVDIDPVIVDLGKKYLELSKHNIKIEIADAYKYVEKCVKSKAKFDLVLIDLYLGFDYPPQFEDEKFASIVKTISNSNAVCVFNRLYSANKRKKAIVFGNKLEKQFSLVNWYYPQANLMFICSN